MRPLPRCLLFLIGLALLAAAPANAQSRDKVAARAASVAAATAKTDAIRARVGDKKWQATKQELGYWHSNKDLRAVLKSKNARISLGARAGGWSKLWLDDRGLRHSWLGSNVLSSKGRLGWFGIFSEPVTQEDWGDALSAEGVRGAVNDWLKVNAPAAGVK